MEWFVQFRDPTDIWKKHPSFLICEIMFYVIALLTLKHGMSVFVCLTIFEFGKSSNLMC